MKGILLTSGKVTHVDDDMFFVLKKYDPNWHTTGSGYAFKRIKGKNIMMHRLIWELKNGKILPNLEIDHINGDRLDNRIENLRVATRAENAKNRHERLWPKTRSELGWQNRMEKLREECKL